MKLEQGDAFERGNANWIRERLPFYEKIWSAFVGHDGSGWPLPMEGLSAQQLRNRKKFYQAHYTFAVEARKVDELVESANSMEGFIANSSDFSRAEECLISLAAKLGRIRDMFKIMDEALRVAGALVAPLQDFYALRSHILHGPRIPFRMCDGFLMIPKVALQNGALGEWDDKSTWDNVDPKGFVYFAEFCPKIREDLFALLSDLHPKIYAAAAAYFDGHRVADAIVGTTTSDARETFSGLSAGQPCFSASVPPSGTRNS